MTIAFSGFFRPVRAALAAVMASALVLSATASSAADRAAADRLLPGETSFFVRLSDLSKSKDGFGKSALGQLWNSSEMEPFRKQIEEKWEEALKKAAEQEVPIADLLSIPQGELAIGVVHEEDGPVGGVAILDYGDKQSALDKALDALDKALEEKGAVQSSETISGAEVTVFTFKDEDDEEVPYKLAYFTKDGTAVFASSTSLIGAVLNRWDGAESDCLGEDEIYSYILKKSKHDSVKAPELEFFVSPIDLIQGILESQEELAFQAALVNTQIQRLGFGQLKGIGGTVEGGLEEYDSWSRTIIYAEQPSQGLMNVFQFPAVKPEVPGWVGAGVATFTTVNWDVQAAWTSIMAAADGFMGKSGATMQRVDALAKNPPNIHIKKDVFDQLTGTFQMVSHGIEAASEGAPQEKQVFYIGIKDETKLKELMGKISEQAPQVQTREFEGKTIYEGPGGGPVQPGASIAFDSLIISTDVGALESALRREDAEKPLSDDADFKALMKGVPDAVSFLSFSRLDKTIGPVYEMARKGELDGLTEAGVDFSVLPEFESISKYFRPQISFAAPDENGAVMEAYSLPLK
jgi:hypothetical protein